MSLTRRATIGAALSLGMSFGLTGPARASPRRVVSLNPCLDTILVHVADRAQIAALSHYARERHGSTIADVARTLPMTYESAEEIISLAPDLVLASQHSAAATRGALARLKIDVATFGVPNTVDESLAQIGEVARLVGRPERGAALTARIQSELAACAPAPGQRPIRALVFQARGLAAGEGTLVDEMMRRTGFENVAARYGINFWGTVQLERLIADPPELLLTGAPQQGATTWSERLMSHPALARVAPRMRRGVFPEPCLYCGGPVLLQTAAALARARTDFWSNP